MSITAAGVGSGIDIESILSQLNQLERQPVNVLNSRKDALDVELSAYGTVKGALSGLQTAAEAMGKADKFGSYVAKSSDEAVFTATATNGKTAESLEVEVLALASTHRMASKAYSSADEVLGNGTLTFSAGDNSFDITVDGTNNTVTGLRDAINDADENTSVSASIINVDGGTRLVITARNSGTEGQISVARSGGRPLGAGSNAGFNEISEATDASLVVHGFTVTSSSNSVSDVIEGVTLDLTGLGTAQMDSSRDTSALRASVDAFVSSYNSMRNMLTSLSQSQLQGDALPRGIDSRMRDAFLGAVDLGNNASTTALDLGFSFDRYGELSINETNFNDSLDLGVERYVNAFARPETGLANRFVDLVEEYTGAGGIIDGREDGVDTRRNSIDDQIERLEYRIDRTSQRLRRQYTAMDQIVTNLQSTSSFLVSRLSAQGIN